MIWAFINNKVMEKFKNISNRLDRILEQAAKKDSLIPAQIQNGIKASYGLSIGSILASFILQIMLFNDLRKNNFSALKSQRFKRPLYGGFGMLIVCNMALFYFCRKAEPYLPQQIKTEDLQSFIANQPENSTSYSLSNANQKILLDK